jgi:signal transduction histidine kinase
MKNISFQEIFESLPGNYLILFPDSPQFTIAAVSDAYAKITLNSREHMLGRGLFDVFPDNPDDHGSTGVANLSASLHNVLSRKQPHKMAIQKYDIPLPDGHGFEEKYWSPLNSPVLVNDEVAFIIHQVDDVTEKIKTSETLEMQSEALKRTNEELEQFVRISSHDLQEPVRKIQTFSELLNAKYGAALDSTGSQLTQKIKESAERMSRRLKDLLRYAYLRREETFSYVDMQEVYDEVHDDLSLLIDEKKAVLNVSEFPVVHGIRHQLHQLLYNLLFNALKFSKPAGPVQIDISVKKYYGEDDPFGKGHLELVISDNGVGFEQQYAEKIFVVFEQLQKGQTGTGMGLALCKKVVENHGGNIYAFGKRGDGASFHVLLPLKENVASY